MNKFAALTLGAALCSALCAVPAFAQEGAARAAAPVPQPERSAFAEKGDFTIEGFGGVTASGKDREVVPTASALAGVQAAWGVGNFAALTATYSYDDIGKVGTPIVSAGGAGVSAGSASVNAGSASVNAKEFEVGLLAAFRKQSRMEPYIRLDLGGISQTHRLSGNALLPGVTQFVVAPGAGLLVPINRYVAFDFGVRAVLPVASDPLPWQIQGLFGVVFRAPHRK